MVLSNCPLVWERHWRELLSGEAKCAVGLENHTVREEASYYAPLFLGEELGHNGPLVNMYTHLIWAVPFAEEPQRDKNIR